MNGLVDIVTTDKKIYDLAHEQYPSRIKAEQDYIDPAGKNTQYKLFDMDREWALKFVERFNGSSSYAVLESSSGRIVLDNMVRD